MATATAAGACVCLPERVGRVRPGRDGDGDGLVRPVSVDIVVAGLLFCFSPVKNV